MSRPVEPGSPSAARVDLLLSKWTLELLSPGVVFAVTDAGHVAIGKFDEHVLAADAVCAHNAVLEVRPRV